MRNRAAAALILLTLLAGCASRPVPPLRTLSVPATFTSGQTASAPPLTDWWQSFDDPVLSSLITRALASNPDVLQAGARIRESREQERITRGNAGPQLNASAQAAETHLSQNALPSGLAGLFSGTPGQSSSGSGGLGLPGESFTTYQLGFDASWELDLFGAQRASNAAAHARSAASLWSARDAQVALGAEVANTYEQYRALQQRLALADEAVAADREALELMQVRFRNGLAADNEVSRQQRQADQSGLQRDELAAELAVRLHALDTLLGMPPGSLASELSVASAAAMPALPEVPPGLPSELLQRRPDLRAAELSIAAATAEARAATADLYPKFSLTGSLQLASRSLSTLLEGDSLEHNVSGRVSLPLFDRDRLKATVRLREAQSAEAVLAYRKAVLGALRDVEDALTRLDAARHRLDRSRAIAQAAEDEADSTAVRYRQGLIAAGEMLSAQQQSRAARDAQLQAGQETAQDLIALYKALGGGWDERRSATADNPGEEDTGDDQGS